MSKKKVTFLYKAEKTKTKRPVKFATKDGDGYVMFGYL